MAPELVGDDVRAACPECGTVCTFETKQQSNYIGVASYIPDSRLIGGSTYTQIRFWLARCASCGRGGLAITGHYQGNTKKLIEFHPEGVMRAKLPDKCPEDIRTEFKEAELCASVSAYRGACALLRSVLEKTLEANGYTSGKLVNKIDAVAGDAVITAARQRRAHENLRVLGNDVLHEPWRQIAQEEYEDAHMYAQRIIEDFYDNRKETEAILIAKGRLQKPAGATPPP